MIFVLSGAVAFPLLCLVDALLLRGSVAGRRAAFCAAAVLEICGVIGCIAVSPRLGIPAGLRLAGGVLGVAALALTVLSVLVAVPTVRVYASPERTQRLVTTGLYAIVRHPGVLSFALLLVALVLATDSRLLAVATPVWIVLDIGHVAWQEKHYLLAVYGDDYRRYQAEVPMLFPTASSIRRGSASVRASVRGSIRALHTSREKEGK